MCPPPKKKTRLIQEAGAQKMDSVGRHESI